MTKEELEKEAEVFVSEKADKGNFDVEKFGIAYFSESSMKQALVKFAEPREKRIEELEESLGKLQKSTFNMIDKKNNRIAELEQKIEVERNSRIALVNKIAELEEKIKLMNEQEAKDIRSRFPC